MKAMTSNPDDCPFDADLVESAMGHVREAIARKGQAINHMRQALARAPADNADPNPIEAPRSRSRRATTPPKTPAERLQFVAQLRRDLAAREERAAHVADLRRRLGI